MYLQTLIFTLLLSVLSSLTGNTESYTELFGSYWNRATEKIAERRAVWNEVFLALDTETTECEAVIFPEQLRYSRLQNNMEQAALWSLYVRGGKQKANFSIGLFQMKPSFAEEVETAWMKSPLRHEYKLYFNCNDNNEVRRRRLQRLTNERWQCVYLAVFIRLMLEREPSLQKLSSEERVSLLATAYNVSFRASLEVLRRSQKRRSFHLDLIPTKRTVYYAYAEIAVERFRQLNE